MTTRKDGFETRQYQVELIQKIKEQNAILFLPTGSGKTFIALEIIKHMQKDLQKPVTEGGKRTIFLVNTVALVEQHYTFIKRHCSLNIIPLSGDAGVDLWNKDQWLEIENKAQILIMTSQIYLNVLTHAYLHLKNANLIIFDECHHAVNKHPMREVMGFFPDSSEEEQPKVLGLSATLLNANTTVLEFSRSLQELQTTFRSKIITSTRIAEVKKFSTKAKEEIVKFTPYTSNTSLTEQINKLVEHNILALSSLRLKEDVENLEQSEDKLLNDQGENRSKLLRNCLKDLMVHMKEYGLYFCYLGCTCYMIQLFRIMFEKCNEELYCNAILLLINVLKAIRKLLYSEISRLGNINKMEVVYKTCSRKLEYLLNQLKQLKENDKCIIFVERRMTAKILYKIIEMFFIEEKCSLAVDFLVGFSVHPLRNSREADFVKRCHTKVLNKFRTSKLNVLVASNVLEEGIDLPDCNLVFMYDFPKTFRSYVQSKGRARKNESTYVLLMDNDIERNLRKIDEFKKLERELEYVVHSYDISNEEDVEDKEELYTTQALATLSKTQAIAIVNLYCSSLPHDIFTVLTPYWWLQKREDGSVCKLQLPMNAAIKDMIIGPKCSNTKEAKQAVAFKAVKMLHQIGALNDNLMPVLVPYETEDEEYWFPNWNESVSTGDGTKTQKRELIMKVPKYLIDCRPVPNASCYLHVINITSEYPTPTLNRRFRCHKLLTMKYELGILTKTRLPPICEFPVYSDLGRVRINIDTNHSVLQLNEEDIKAVSLFHRFLFLKALQIVRKCLFYATDENYNDYFVVPLITNGNKKMEIAWDVCKNHREIKDIIVPSDEDRMRERFTKENYWGSVVVPWYRPFTNKIQYFVITEVDTGLTLQSDFPTPRYTTTRRYTTFAEYFKGAYGLEALRPAQPMMEARPITHHLDGIRPRSTTSDKSEKKKNDEQCVYIAPEFCLKQDFPACYWYKATVLPSVLHRLYYLLLAEEMREKIATEAGIGTVRWTKGKEDFLECAEKYDLKKRQKDTEQSRKTRSNTKKSRYSRTTARSELTLAKLLEDENLPLDLDRNKNITVKDIKKFVSYCLQSLQQQILPSASDEMISYLSDCSISNAQEIKFEKPPSLSTLIERKEYKGPRQHEILEALTPVSCHDIINLERLETLGDSFLKFAVSFTIFVKCKGANEGHMTTLKGRLVGNRNLLYCGNKLELGSYLKLNRFSAYCNWCPPGFVVPRTLKNNITSLTSPVALFRINIPFNEQFSGTISLQTIENMKNDVLRFQNYEANNPNTIKLESDAMTFLNRQKISDKTVADAVEALIGIYVKTGGIKPAFQVLKYFGIVANPSYEEIMESKTPSPLMPKTKLCIEDLIPNYHLLEKSLSYEFNDKAYIVQALTHPSYIKNNMTDCYQTLEFIGDAILDFLITSYIFEYCGNLPPGKLTDLRASLVNNNTFGALTVRLGLHKFLLSSNKKLSDALNRFIEYQELNNFAIHGNELMIMISDDDVKIAEEVEIPKVLGDIFESIAGAIFLDSGNDLKEVWRVYYNIMKEEIRQFSENIPINPVRALYEEPGLKVKFLTQQIQLTEDERLKKFISGNITVPLRIIRGDKEYLYYGRGENTDLCKRAAAKLALKDLGRKEFVI